MAVPSLLGLRLVLVPLEIGAAVWAAEQQFGLLHQFALSPWLHGVLSFMLLDYILYLWHRLNHHIRFLWRFHNVHHTDRDLGVSTAFRFHFGEMIMSAFFRAVGVVLIGAGPVSLLVYEVIFQASVAFHHSNWRLPYRLERVLCHLIVTPRMHGIHHSVVQRETNSNYSSLLTIWDRIHRTLRLNVAQASVTIGVPAYQDEGPEHSTIGGLLMLPFRRQRDYWRLPDGKVPDRESNGRPEQLLR